MTSEDPVKERVMALAAERFFSDGFAKVTVDELAAELVMSKKTIYKLFESKEDILNQIVDRTMAEIAGKLSRIVHSDKNFIEKLNGLLEFVGWLIRKFSRAFERDLRRQAPEIWNRIESFRRERMNYNLTQLIDQGVREGFIRSDFNKEILLLAYIASVDRIVHPEVLADKSFSAREAIQGIMRLFFMGILTDEARMKLIQFQDTQHPIPS
jgi:AcrR family transcriptional regulator